MIRNSIPGGFQSAFLAESSWRCILQRKLVSKILGCVAVECVPPKNAPGRKALKGHRWKFKGNGRGVRCKAAIVFSYMGESTGMYRNTCGIGGNM